MTKRLFDLLFSAFGIIILLPVLVPVALAVKLGDGGRVFYRQQRVGRHGRIFFIWKFRTMVENAEKTGLSVTRDGDSRITPVGRFLRKTKLDELPQLWNVLIGNMSFVGPRPEVPKYVACYSEEQRKVLDLKPGITDLASIHFRDEETLLSTAVDVERFYIDYCIPKKIELNLRYAKRANIFRDLQIIFMTLLAIQPPENLASSPSEKKVSKV